MRTADVIVIGGGVAGLSAAAALAERGARVTLVEARPGLGGRASSYLDPATREPVDNGQHVLLGCYRETFAFLRRIGAGDAVGVQPSLEVPFVDPDGRPSTLKCPALPAPLHLLAGVLGWNALSWRDRLSVLGMGPAILHARRDRLRTRLGDGARDGEIGPGGRPPAVETVEQWLMRHGQTPRLREMLWEPLALAALNQPANEAAAPAFARVLAEMFGTDPLASSLALSTLPLDETFGSPARRFIESRGGTVLTNAVARVVVSDRRVTGIRLRGSEEVAAPCVVSAVPWHAVRGLFDELPTALTPVFLHAHRMRACPIVTVNFWLDHPVLAAPFVGLPGRRMQWVFEKRRILGDRATHLSLVSSGASDLVPRSNDDIAAFAISDLRTAVPSARGTVIRRVTVVRERLATFSLAPGEPPRPAARTELQGFVLAGDWTDTGLPGTIESAALSGHRAATLGTG